MLLCVCLWVCNLCVKECVFLAHCANVCVALILVFPLTIPTSPLLFSPHFWWWHTNPPVNLNPSLISPSCHYLKPSTFPCMRRPTASPLPSTRPSIHLPTHWFIAFGFRHQPSSPFPSLLISALSLFLSSPLLSLPHPVHSVLLPSSLPLSLFHTVLCASLALAGLLLGGWEFVCTQVPAEHPLHPGSQPGSASLLLILLLLLLSLPFSPEHSISTVIICPLSTTPHPTSWWTHPPPHRPASWHNPVLSLPVWSTLLLGRSLVCPQTLLEAAGLFRLREARSLHACLAKPLCLCLHFYLLRCAWSSEPVSPFWLPRAVCFGPVTCPFTVWVIQNHLCFKWKVNTWMF